MELGRNGVDASEFRRRLRGSIASDFGQTDHFGKLRYKIQGRTYRIYVEIGKVLKPTDFDESTTGGRTVGGVVLPNEGGSIKSIIPLNDFCPLEETEIVPYFAPEKGDLALYASGSLGDHYFDENGNDLSKNIDYKLIA